MRSRDVSRIGMPAADAWDRSDYFASGTKPVRPGNVRAAIQLDELREINFTPEGSLDSVDIRPKSVTGKPKTTVHPFAKVAHKSIRTSRITAPDIVRKNH